LSTNTNYTETLKRIKDAEEASNREVAEKKKDLEAELLSIEQAADSSIEATRKDAELSVEKAGEAAKESSQKEADALLASARKKAEEISSRRLGKKELGKIVDSILFAEFKEG
jgi:vacuolar-type H+-ATPase subunit H